MREHIKESDWKAFKPIREAALERFCERVLAEVQRIAADAKQTQHERYLKVYRLLQKRDPEIDRIFDYLRRSTAIMQIAAFRDRELITEKEFNRFSEETRAVVNTILGL